MTLDRRVEIVPLGDPPPAPDLLAALAAAVEERFGIPTVIGDRLPGEPGWCGPDGRLDSNIVVDCLVGLGAADAPTRGHWTLGVCVQDLAVRGRDFVFGEATFGGAWALVSMARLNGGEDVLLRRLIIEAVHELGHLAALEHCSRAPCVMGPSASLRELDRKRAGFCRACAEKLAKHLNLDPAKLQH